VNKIERQVEGFDRGTDVTGIVHVGVVDINANGSELAAHSNGLSGKVSQDLLFFERSVILGGGSGILTSRSIFDEVGGFDTALSTSADWDLFYRIGSRYETVFIQEPLLKYRIHGTNMHGNVRRMEYEMLYAFSKVFSDEDQELRKIKGKAYGNFYRVVSGSYFQAGEIGNFLRTAAKSIWYRPAGIAYFAAFPFRRFARRK
jgi:hypothetical protein